MKVLITGGTGALGVELVRAATAAGHAVRVMSRRPRTEAGAVEWVRADLTTGDGVAAAVEGVRAIVHAASDPRNAAAVDVGGTRRLVEAARSAGAPHVLYVSIVGVDAIPYSYYRRKLAAEEIIRASEIPHTVFRATQFHSLVYGLLAGVGRIPAVMPLPAGFVFQSVAEPEVAARIVSLLDAPSGRAPDFGGPEILPLAGMARTWLELRGVRKRVIELPVPGRVAGAFRAGRNTAPGGVHGTITWRAWLEARRAARTQV